MDAPLNKARWIARAIAVAASIGCGAHFIAAAQETAPAGAAKTSKPAFTVDVRPYDMKRLTSEAALPDDVYRGRTLWLQRCAYCHDGVGQPSYNTLGPWIGAETVQKYTEEGVKTFVGVGTDRMPGFNAAFKPQQFSDIIAFLKTRGPETKPTKAQLDGKAPGQASTD